MEITRKNLKQKIKQLRYLIRSRKTGKIKTPIMLADNIYYCATEYDLNQMMRTFIPQDVGVWERGEIYDCDDFAYELKAHIAKKTYENSWYKHPLAFGMVWGKFKWAEDGKKQHACNWMLNHMCEIKWIEPQTKKFFNTEACIGKIRLLLG